MQVPCAIMLHGTLLSSSTYTHMQCDSCSLGATNPNGKLGLSVQIKLVASPTLPSACQRPCGYNASTQPI